jgi:hypothetical protein
MGGVERYIGLSGLIVKTESTGDGKYGKEETVVGNKQKNE